jgi:hypothetical protein
MIIVENERSFTKGYVSIIKYLSIGTQKSASHSGLFIAIVFGTSSPMTIEKYVIPPMATARAILSA